MGKTPLPLKIVLLPPFSEQPWVQALEDKGHIVYRLDGQPQSIEASVFETADLILGFQCHYLDARMSEKHVELALKWARTRKKVREKK